MQRTAVKTEAVPASHPIFGKAPLVRAVYEGGDVSAIWDQLFARVNADPTDAGAFLDLSIFLHSKGEKDPAAICQVAALDICRQFRIRNGRGTGLTILAFVTAGNFMANTPIEFLLEQSDTNIALYYVDADTKDLMDVPDHDIAFVAIGESLVNRPALEKLDRLLEGWTGPILNNASHRIIALTRDSVADAFRGEPSILAPATARASRETIAKLAAGEIEVGMVLLGNELPVIVRPVDTHAGEGMEKIASREELNVFLETRPENEFYILPFVDYRSNDGKFRKQRIAFINGKAFASHLAISDHWMVHYLSAGMAEDGHKRAEESLWMANFDEDFAIRHARSFDALHRRIGLDYFAIDCAELADGRLLLFEADTAMIVHSMDPASLFPYKKTAMSKLFNAFEDALQRRVARASSTSAIKCAHSGKPVVYQRTDNDCLICVLAMFTGKTYEEIEEIAFGCDHTFPRGGPMSHSIMRGVANECGFALLSSIYMLWSKPAIIGVVSPTLVTAGHAVFWDGQKIIDPGVCDRVDRSYVDRCGLEFTQRAIDLEQLISYDNQISYRAGAVSIHEPL